MFKNIERKQIAIDERQHFFQELEEKEKARESKNNNKNSNISQIFDDFSNQMFNSNFIESVKNMKTNSLVTESFPFEVVSRMLDSHIQNSNNLEDSKNQSKMVRLENSNKKKSKPFYYKKLEDYNLPELVEKFLSKDVSLSDDSFREAKSPIIKQGKS